MKIFRNIQNVRFSKIPECRNFYFSKRKIYLDRHIDAIIVENHQGIQLYANTGEIIIEIGGTEERIYLVRTVAVYAILFRFFRPDQLSEPVKVGRDRSGNVDRSGIMGHFDWQSTRQKAARNVGDWTDNGTGGGAVRLVIRHEESRWRSVNDDRNAWPSALCMTRAARTRPLINHVDCNISVYVMYIPFDFAALSKRNESNLKEEEEKIKFRRANEKNENSKRGKKFWRFPFPLLSCQYFRAKVGEKIFDQSREERVFTGEAGRGETSKDK